MRWLTASTPEERLYCSLIIGAIALMVFIFRKRIMSTLTQRPWTAERLMRTGFWLMVLFIFLAILIIFLDRDGFSLNLIQEIQ